MQSRTSKSNNTRRPRSSRATSNANSENISNAVNANVINGYESNVSIDRLTPSQYRNHLQGYTKRKQIETASRSIHKPKRAKVIRETFGDKIERSAATKAFRDHLSSREVVELFPYSRDRGRWRAGTIDQEKIKQLTILLNRGADPTGPMLSYLFRSRNMSFVKLVIKSFLRYHSIDSKFNTNYSPSEIGRTGTPRSLILPTTLLDCAIRHVNVQAAEHLLELGANPKASKRGHALNNLIVSDKDDWNTFIRMVEANPIDVRVTNLKASDVFEMLALFERHGQHRITDSNGNVLDRILEARNYHLDNEHLSDLSKTVIDLCIRIMRDLRLFPAKAMPLQRAVHDGVAAKPVVFAEFVVMLLSGPQSNKSLFMGALKSLYLRYEELLRRGESTKRYIDYMRIVLDIGADQNERDNNGNTILHTIANDIILAQKRYWASFSDVGEQHHKTVQNSHKQLLTLLIDEYSANPFVKNKNGKTALDLMSPWSFVRQTRAYKYLVKSMEQIPKRAAARNVLDAHGVNRNMQQHVLKKANLTRLSSTHAENSNVLRKLRARPGFEATQKTRKPKRERQIELNRTVSILQKWGKLH